MTDIGYTQIIDKIKNRNVDVPTDKNVTELMGWMTGYATCQNDIIDILMELRKGSGQR